MTLYDHFKYCISNNTDRDCKWIIVDTSGDIILDNYCFGFMGMFLNDLEVLPYKYKTNDEGGKCIYVTVDPSEYYNSTSLFGFYYDLPYYADNIRVLLCKDNTIITEDYASCPPLPFDDIIGTVKKCRIYSDRRGDTWVDIYIDLEGYKKNGTERIL